MILLLTSFLKGVYCIYHSRVDNISCIQDKKVIVVIKEWVPHLHHIAESLNLSVVWMLFACS